MAATAECVIISERELNDTSDSFHCFAADSGKLLWSHTYPALGSLDYGNSPRATPVIAGDRVFVTGAFGQLAALELKTGKIIWELELREDFKASDERKWGMCSTPILDGDRLIVNPGGKDASIVALDAKTGKVLWKTPGRPASYGNFIIATLGGKRQLVGHDLDTLGGWDLETGKRLWEWVPPLKGDFNVPTPIVVDGQLVIMTENNNTRLFRFNNDGTPDPKPVAVNKQLHNDTQSPIATAGRLFGAHKRLFCLDLKNGLKTIWSSDDGAFDGFCSLVASETRVLATCLRGEVILFDAQADSFKELGRWTLFGEEQMGYAHPALAGTRLYLRGNAELLCIELGGK